MIYTVADKVVFIPKWNGNKDLPEAEQMSIVVYLPTPKELAESYLNDKNSAVVNEFLLYVKTVKNFKIVKDGKEKEATPKDLLNTSGLTELWAEIKNFYTEYKTVSKKK